MSGYGTNNPNPLGAQLNYRVVFFDHGGHVYSVTALVADNDSEAIGKAHRIFDSGIGMGYEIRRDGELIHTELHEAPPPRSDGSMKYTVWLVDAERHAVAAEPIEAESETEALQMAAVLFDACSDICEGYELWRGDVPLRNGMRGEPSPLLTALRDHAQTIVIQREVVLRDSRTAIAESKRLLEKLQAALEPRAQ